MKPAVVVIDVQVGVFETEPGPLNKKDVLARINQVTTAARVAGAPIVFLQHDGSPEEQWLTPFTDDWMLHPLLSVSSADRVFRKKTCDGFYETELESYLRGKGVETIIVMGYATDFCVDTTIRCAASRRFSVIAVTDAHTTKDRPVLEAEQVRAHHEWVWSNLICPRGVALLSADEVIRKFHEQV